MKVSKINTWAGLMIITVVLILPACSPSSGEQPQSSPTPSAAPTKETSSEPSTLDILKELEPTFNVHFDGEDCEVEGPSEIKKGEYLFVLHNQTDLPASVTIGSYFGDGSYQDHFQWREEICGGQGTKCLDEDGNGISYSMATWYSPLKTANEEELTYYKLFKVDMTREYVIWVYSDGWWGWLCAPFQVQ